jgi:hypothetical protein
MGKLIIHKIWFLRNDIDLVHAFIDLAITYAARGDQKAFTRLKEKIAKALATIERLIEDNRIPLPQQAADSLTAGFLMCTNRFRSL